MERKRLTIAHGFWPEMGFSETAYISSEGQEKKYEQIGANFISVTPSSDLQKQKEI